MINPKPGDRATRNGITAWILLVEGGWIWGVRFPKGHCPARDAAEFIYDRRQPADRVFGDHLGEFRISLTDWRIAVQDAVYERTEA